ncbi:MAG: hypothetical protein LCH81_22715 [Bacteroidetes bacterium]|nr:hypothetical protein [Bacteroidota bacterium]
MKRSAFTAFIGWILVLEGCSSSRALPEETALFPSPRLEKWWIINTVFRDENDKDVHLCLLMTLTPSDDRYFTHFFTSLWMEADSAYYSGSQSSEEPFYQKKDKFPIKLAIPAKDSASFGWYWKLDRKSMRLQSVFQQPSGQVYWPLHVKVNRAQDSAFHVLKAPGETTLYHVPPALAALHVSGAWQMNAPAVLQCHVIDSGRNLLEKTKHNFISWLDISLSQELRLSVLYETDAQGNMQVLSQTFWQKGQVVDTISALLTTQEGTIWPGARKNTAYPLRFSIAVPEKKIDVLVGPRMEAQEISGRNNSFWMGAVQATDPVADTIVGVGNLYVLKQ